MAEDSPITVPQLSNELVDRAKQDKQWVDVHISQCLERCALASPQFE
jgi:hypothetical protein